MLLDDRGTLCGQLVHTVYMKVENPQVELTPDLWIAFLEP